MSERNRISIKVFGRKIRLFKNRKSIIVHRPPITDYQISVLLANGFSQSEIANLCNVNKSSFSRLLPGKTKAMRHNASERVTLIHAQVIRSLPPTFISIRDTPYKDRTFLGPQSYHVRTTFGKRLSRS